MIKDSIIKALIESTPLVGSKVLPNVTFSADKKNGDLTTNFALITAKEIETSPKILAEKIKKDIEVGLNGIVEKIEVAGPGFINFFLRDEAIISGLKEIEEKIKKSFEYLDGQKINVEFISANPTGELHIGHGRGAFYGDALSNVLDFSGARVTREFYINDSKESNQIKELGKTALGEGDVYLTEKLKTQIEKLEKNSDSISDVGFLLSNIVQKDNQNFIEKDLGIKFDVWYSEDEKLRASKINDKTLVELKKKDLVYEKDGAIWLKTSEYGDDEDRVVVRSDGTASYFLSDISYHANKFSRGYTSVIDIWGADHHGHVKRIEAVKKMLGWQGDFRVFITQLVSLKESGEISKMSKRAGNVILLSDLVNEFSIDVVRWFFNEKTLSTHMEFDMKRAREQTDKNPVFYVQYAHARMNSIIEKSKGLPEDLVELKDVIKEKSTRELSLKIMQFSETIEEIAKDFQVNKLTTYAYELASEFSGFYRDVRVVSDDSYNKGALEIVMSTKNVLAKTLSLLGISAPEKM